MKAFFTQTLGFGTMFSLLLFFVGALIPYIWSEIGFLGVGLVVVAVAIYDFSRRVSLKYSPQSQWVQANLISYRALIKRAKAIQERSAEHKHFFTLYIVLTALYWFVGYLFSDLSGGFIVSEILYLVFDFYSLLFLVFNSKKHLPYPKEILEKKSNLDVIASFSYPSCFRLTPEFDMRKLSGGQQVPVDVRFVLDYQHKSEEWVSLSISTRLNRVQGTGYPFTYMVFVAKGQGALYQGFSKISPVNNNWEKQLSPGEEYSTVALINGASYHTGANSVRGLIEHVCRFIEGGMKPEALAEITTDDDSANDDRGVVTYQIQDYPGAKTT